MSLGVGSAAPGYVSLLLVLLIVDAGYRTVRPGGSKSVASWFDASQRRLAMGIRQAGLPLGGMLAAAVLPSSPLPQCRRAVAVDRPGPVRRGPQPAIVTATPLLTRKPRRATGGG